MKIVVDGAQKSKYKPFCQCKIEKLPSWQRHIGIIRSRDHASAHARPKKTINASVRSRQRQNPSSSPRVNITFILLLADTGRPLQDNTHVGGQDGESKGATFTSSWSEFPSLWWSWKVTSMIWEVKTWTWRIHQCCVDDGLGVGSLLVGPLLTKASSAGWLE